MRLYKSKRLGPASLVIPTYAEDTVITMDEARVSISYLQYHILRSPETIELSNEGLVSFTKKFIFGIANTFFHVVNNFKTMFVAYRAFKRSELRYYLESTPLTYSRVLRLDYQNIRSTSVSVPRGMRGTYLNAAVTLDKALTFIDMVKKSKAARDLVTDIHRSIVIQSETDTVSRRHGAHVATLFDSRVLSKYKKDVDAVYTDTPSGSVRFDTVFKSMAEFKQVTEQLMRMETYLITVSTICDQLDAIEQMFQDIITRCETKQIAITKNDMVVLTEVSLLFATVFDMYGVWIDDLNRTTHNHFQVLKQLEPLLS